MSKMYKRCKFLTNEDVAYINERTGFDDKNTTPETDREIYQIDLAARISRFYVLDDEKEKQISRKSVLKILDRDEFLGGLCRSAFHHTTSRMTNDGVEIHFNSGAIWSAKGEEEWRKYYIDAPMDELKALGFTEAEMRRYGCKAFIEKRTEENN